MDISWDVYKLAYLAGFFDGEGNIHISKTRLTDKHDGRLSNKYTLVVSVGNVCKKIINLFHDEFGGFISYRKSNKLSCRPFWVWTVTSRKASYFLEKIIFYLRIKREQANIALEFQRTKGTNIINNHFGRIKSDIKYIQYQEDQKQKISSLCHAVCYLEYAKLETNYVIPYCAGFFDAEGTILIACDKYAAGITRHNLQVTLSNTDKQNVNYFSELYGGSTLCRKNNVNKINMVWKVRCNKAFKFLVLIIDYLIVKQQQANIAIDFQKEKMLIKHNRWNKITSSEFMLRDKQKENISLLNRGVY